MNENKNIYAVLTGDLVQSSTLAPEDLQAMMQALREAAGQFAKVYPDTVVGKLDVFSGDGWQLLMSGRGLSIRAGLYLRAVVKGWRDAKLDTRIAVAWGSVDQATLNPERISQSTGQAFTESGRALAAMNSGSRMALVCTQAGLDTKMTSAAICLLDEVATRWKPGQARAVSLRLLGLTQEQVAKRLEISQASANQAIRTAGWAAIDTFLAGVEL